MIRQGEVVERGEGTISVVFERPSACGDCRGCLTARCARVELAGEADVGDLVDVEMPEGRFLKASALTYLIPLALFLLGLYLGTLLHGPLGLGMDAELFCAACALALLALGGLIVYGAGRRLRRRRDWMPRVARVYKKES